MALKPLPALLRLLLLPLFFYSFNFFCYNTSTSNRVLCV